MNNNLENSRDQARQLLDKQPGSLEEIVAAAANVGAFDAVQRMNYVRRAFPDAPHISTSAATDVNVGWNHLAGGFEPCDHSCQWVG